MKPLVIAIVLAVVMPFYGRTESHEFWIEPSMFQANPGSVIRIGLRVGERFLGEPVMLDSALIENFTMTGASGVQPLIGLSGTTTSFAHVTTTGLHWISYQSRHSFNQLTAEEFDRYLKDEGLEYILLLRTRLGENSQPGREVYSRCAKALISIGQGSSAGYNRLIGLPLELVLQQNPYALQAGDELSVQLLYDEQPLDNSLLVAVNRATPHDMKSVRTNALGEAKFRLSSPGAWMVTAIHMTRASGNVDADWESFWASLTFELPDRKTVKK